MAKTKSKIIADQFSSYTYFETGTEGKGIVNAKP